MTSSPVKKNAAPDDGENLPPAYNDMFIWNHYLLKSGFRDLNSRSGWILPLIYGFVDQASTLASVHGICIFLTMFLEISVFGRSIAVTLMARRSRHFAGARFLKRGANDMVSME